MCVCWDDMKCSNPRTMHKLSLACDLSSFLQPEYLDCENMAHVFTKFIIFHQKALGKHFWYCLSAYYTIKLPSKFPLAKSYLACFRWIHWSRFDVQDLKRKKKKSTLITLYLSSVVLSCMLFSCYYLYTFLFNTSRMLPV